MSNVEVYIKPTCPYCVRAISLLKRKNVDFKVYNLFDDRGIRPKMIQRANGRTTVPQIFINNKGIGGSDELHALERAGKLDQLLAS